MPVINLYLRNLDIAGYHVPTVTLLAIVAYLAWVAVSFHETKRLKLSYAITFMMILLTFILEESLTRFFYALSRIFLHHDFDSQKTLMGFYPERKVYFGYFLSAFISPWLASHVLKAKGSFYKYLDISLLGHIVALFFFRIVNVVTYFHPGKVTSVPWGVYNLGYTRHEPSLYEAVSLVSLFVVSMMIRKKIKKPGLLSALIVAWMTLSRFITDFFRSDDLPDSNFHFSNGLTLNQLAYFTLFLVSVLIILRITRSGGKDGIWRGASS